MTPTLMALLRLIHILSGIFWVGATIVLAAFLLPAARAVGPSAGALMTQLMQGQRLQRWINISMTLAILAGFALYGIDSRAAGGGFGRSAMGMTLGLGALLAIIAAGVGGALVQPTGRKLGAIALRMSDAQRGTATPGTDLATEVEPLRRKMALGLTIMAWLLVLSATTMAIARYV